MNFVKNFSSIIWFLSLILLIWYSSLICTVKPLNPCNKSHLMCCMILLIYSWIQFVHTFCSSVFIRDCYCSVNKSCLTLCATTDCSTPGFPVLHHLPELAQIHVHWVSDTIQPSHPLSSPSPPAFSLSKHQGTGYRYLLYGPTVRSIHDYWKNHSFDYVGLCRQRNVSAF